jgi:two-component system sensor histidine kinase UhpB
MPRLSYLLLLLSQTLFLLAGAQPAVDDSLLRIIHENRQDLAEAKAMNMLVTEYNRGDQSKEKALLWQSIALSEKLNDPEQRDVAYTQMMLVQVETGHVDSAKYYLSLVKKLADENACSVCTGNYYGFAGLFYKLQGNYRAALPFMIETLKLNMARAKEKPNINARTAVAGQYLNVGNTYISLGEYKNSLQYHLKALQSFEELNNKRGISFCYQSVGGDFLMLAQLRQARIYTEKAILLKTQLGDQRGIATSLKQTGDIQLGLNNYDSTLYYYMEALKIDRNIKLSIEEAEVCSDIGKAYALKKDPVNARLYYHQSRFAALQTGDSSRVAAVDAALIDLEASVDKQQREEENLVNSLNVSIERGDMNAQLDNYKYLADHFAANRQFDKALEYRDRYDKLNDSLTNNDLQLQVRRMEEQYNLEKKEQEIVLLKKDQELSHVSLQKQKAFQLGAIGFLILLILIGFLIINRNRIVHNARRAVEMEKMRNRIARDLHDDIGSTLTSINVLSNVALQPQEKEEMVMRVNLQKIKDRSSAIMENMGDIVWAINPQNDTMEQLLFRMKEFAVEILEPLNINYTFEEQGAFSSLKLDIKKRKDIYLLFKEAINNAAKYSRCRNLHIRFIQQQQSLRMEITDDGIGFVESEIRKGNGLNNMRERAASMTGAIRIDSTAGKGAHIALDIPIT